MLENGLDKPTECKCGWKGTVGDLLVAVEWVRGDIPPMYACWDGKSWACPKCGEVLTRE